MADYRNQVIAAIRATAFQSPTSYSWLGRPSQQLLTRVKRALPAQTARGFLLFTLQVQLYNDFYCPGHAAPSRRRIRGGSTVPSLAFIEKLSAANSGSGCREGGWVVRRIEGGRVIVRRHELDVWVNHEDCLIGKDEPLEIGKLVSLCLGKELFNISPGFYVALGDSSLDDEETKDLVRVYWNLTAGGAVRLMKTATALLNRANIPFKLKALKDPYAYGRCDAAVLYIRKSEYSAVREVLEAIYRRMAGCLKPAVPAFTKSLGNGVALAESPSNGDSFGLHRCGLLADGLIRGYERRKTLLGDRLRVVEERFSEDGIGFDAPYLRPGSKDEYEFQPRRRPPSSTSQAAMPALCGVKHCSAFLRTADELGHRLCRRAVWHNGRCNWLGAQEPPMEHWQKGRTSLALKALGPELYGGTSGIALFLAELHVATGDAQVRDTALGAMRHALSRIDALCRSSRFGLYTGCIGIAYAAARAGTVLNEEELRVDALRILRQYMWIGHDDQELDIISGRAGTIAGLLALRRVLGDPLLLDCAGQLGDELLQAASVSRSGYSWPSACIPCQHNLTGFAHGAAGIGSSLLELYAATGDAKYRAAAEGAFSYERSWFDAETSNWPDFREEPGCDRRMGKRLRSFATAWCHGAPGIALSRLRAYKILKDEVYKAEAITALRTTRKAIEAWLYSGHENYSLCHGVTGNADVLLSGYEMLGEEVAVDAALARHAACARLKRCAVQGKLGYSGTDADETPSLMLGLAGIGYFYLRLHKRSLPSVLILA